MDLKHKHVDHDRHQDQTEGSGQEVFHPDSRGDFEIAPQEPQLVESGGANGGNDEQTHPLDTPCQAQTKSCQEEPNQPVIREGLLALVVEVDPGQYSERGEEDERRVQKNKTALGDNAVLCFLFCLLIDVVVDGCRVKRNKKRAID